MLYLYFEDGAGLKFRTARLGHHADQQGHFVQCPFTDGEEAGPCLNYSKLVDRLEIKSPGIYQSAVTEIFSGPNCASDYAADLRSRTACQAGQFFEKLGEKDLARVLYRVGSSPQSHNRIVFLLYGFGGKADSEDLLRRMIDDPASDNELYSCGRLLRPKIRRSLVGPCTELLRSAITFKVENSYRGNPEVGVAAEASVYLSRRTLSGNRCSKLFFLGRIVRVRSAS